MSQPITSTFFSSPFIALFKDTTKNYIILALHKQRRCKLLTYKAIKLRSQYQVTFSLFFLIVNTEHNKLNVVYKVLINP